MGTGEIQQDSDGKIKGEYLTREELAKKIKDAILLCEMLKARATCRAKLMNQQRDKAARCWTTFIGVKRGCRWVEATIFYDGYTTFTLKCDGLTKDVSDVPHDNYEDLIAKVAQIASSL